GLLDRVRVGLAQADEMPRIRQGERTQLQARRDDRGGRLANRLSHAAMVPSRYAEARSGAHARRALSLRSWTPGPPGLLLRCGARFAGAEFTIAQSVGKANRCGARPAQKVRGGFSSRRKRAAPVTSRRSTSWRRSASASLPQRSIS